ncbi:MAG TPA: EAL domain-containing protein [Nocardioides sp.]|nr:EAL domain-containing protein [Nocardioides sp.]
MTRRAPRSLRSGRAAVLTTAGFAALYALAMLAGRMTHVPSSELALAWPASGVVIVWFLTCRTLADRLLTTAVVVVVSGVINQTTGVEAVGSWLFGLVNASTGWVGVAVLRRSGRWDRPRSVETMVDLRDLGLASLAGAAVSAASGGVVAWERFGTDLWDGMGLIGFRNALSAFVVTVALLAVPAMRRQRSGRTASCVAIVLGALVASFLLMESSWPVAFTLLPPLLVVAVRCGYAITAVVVALQGVIVVAATADGRGPFTTVDSAQGRVLLAQVLILVLALAGLFLALAVRERDAALASSRRDRDRFRDHMEAAVVANAHLGFGLGNEVFVVDVNAALETLVGRNRADLVAADPTGWLDPTSVLALEDGITSLAAGSTSRWRGRLQFLEDFGGAYVDAALSVVDPGARAGGVELNLQMIDITAQTRAEQRLADLALHDELTGLPNRALWTDRLRVALAEASRTEAMVGVLYVDVDHFKIVNDSHGHDVGDELLREIARRLSGAVRPHDTVARIGGDEFVVLCPLLHGREDGTRLAARIQAVMAAPVDVGFMKLSPSVSIGVAFASGEDDPRVVLRRADAALYAAKGEGRARFAVYRPDLDTALERSAKILADLERAQANGELTAYYQTIVDGRSGRPVALEALLRWRTPDGDVLLPGAFLDVLEGSDLVHGVGEQMLHQACNDTAELSRHGFPLAVHVNVSARELSRPGLLLNVRSALAESGLPPEQLVLEITETKLVTITGSLLRDMVALRDLGARVAVDDFGTGYSALTHLVDLPVDIVKLDKGFVSEMVTNRSARAVGAGVSAMAAGLGIVAIAEGVEDSAQADLLLAMGYSQLQGYLFSRPLPVAELLTALRTGVGSTPAGVEVPEPATDGGGRP